MSSRGPGKLRGSNIFLKKDKEIQEKKKRAVAPPPTPPPQSKFTPEAIARRESLQRRKSTAEGASDINEAADNVAAGIGARPPPPSAPQVPPHAPPPKKVEAVEDDIGDGDDGGDGNPNMGRASIIRGSRSLPKTKRSFRSSVVEGTDDIEKALAEAREIAAAAETGSEGGDGDQTPAPPPPTRSSPRPPPPKPPTTSSMPPPPKGPPGAPSSDSGDGDDDDDSGDKKEEGDPFMIVDETTAKSEKKAEDAFSRRLSMRNSAPPADMYADLNRNSEVVQFENPMKASDLPPPPSTSASEDEQGRRSSIATKKKGGNNTNTAQQEHLASVSKTFGRPEALRGGDGGGKIGEKGPGTGAGAGAGVGIPVPPRGRGLNPPPPQGAMSDDDEDEDEDPLGGTSMSGRPLPAGPPSSLRQPQPPTPTLDTTSPGTSPGGAQNPFHDVEGEIEPMEESKDENARKRSISGGGGGGVSPSSKPTFYQGVTPRGSGSAVGYTRNSLSSADLIRLNDLFDKWVGRLSSAVEENVNKSLVGLAGITLASGSLAPVSAPPLSKTGTVAIETPQKSLFTVRHMEYKLKEEAAASKDNSKALLSSILASHNRELETLKESVAKEREATVHAQRAMEHSLKLRVDNLSDALAVKVKQEADLRLTRAVELAHRQSLNDSAAIIKMYEAEKESELKVSGRFKEIVSELHASWEQEQSLRTEHLADVSSSHYRAVIDHLEKQLSSALSLQSEVDKRWLEELETRSKNQAETLYAFEEKCKNLYNDRFRKYVKVSNKKLTSYEKQLLEVGQNLSVEKNKYESRLRRVKWACLKWKRIYQQEVESRYVQAIETLESQYGSEIERLLSEVSDTRSAVSASVTRLSEHEKVYLETKAAQESIHTAAAAGGADGAHDITAGAGASATTGGGVSTADLVHELTLAWDKQRVAPEEKIRLLTTLLNESAPTPALIRTYEHAHARLEARVPLLEIRSKKNYLEFKFRQSKGGSNGGGSVGPEATALQKELKSVTASFEDACRKYQAKFNETFEA